MEILHEKGHPIARHDSDLPTLVSVIDKRNYIAWLVTCQQSTIALFHHDSVYMVADSHPSYAMHEPTRSNITDKRFHL
jgi:hypothetical protein